MAAAAAAKEGTDSGLVPPPPLELTMELPVNGEAVQAFNARMAAYRCEVGLG